MKIKKEISNEAETVKLLYGNISIKKLQGICEIYLNKMDFEFLKFPRPSILQISETSIIFEQEHIRGVTIKDYISNSEQYASFEPLFCNLLNDVVKFNRTRYRLDLNLCNFVLSTDSVFLVDFLPPICLDFVTGEYTNDYLKRLFCDQTYGLIAMLYYYIKGIALNRNISIDIKEKVITGINDIFKNKISNSDLEIDAAPFETYLERISEYLKNKSDPFLQDIKNDSFLRFLKDQHMNSAAISP